MKGIENSEDLIGLLSADLLNIGQVINENIEIGSKEIRNYQEKWQDIVYEENVILGDPNLKFLIFFLCNFIEDIYFNLTGDFPQEKFDYEIRKIRETFFKALGEIFLEIGNYIKNNEIQKCYESYIKIVEFYLIKIKELNSLLTPKII